MRLNQNTEIGDVEKTGLKGPVFFCAKEKTMNLKAALLSLTLLVICTTVFAEEKRFSIPVGDSPQKGPADAHVTIIEFIDFQ